MEAGEQEPTQSLAERIRIVGGLTAVGMGVLAVTVIAIAALITGGQTAATIASASGGVIASIVGAYFGVKIGTDQTKNAVEAERQQAAKTAVFAAHLAPQDAERVLELADASARGERPAEAGDDGPAGRR